MLKDAPIVFDFQHIISLLYCIVSVNSITIFVKVRFCLTIYMNPDIITCNLPSILFINNQHSHSVKSVFAPCYRIPAEPVRQYMTD